MRGDQARHGREIVALQQHIVHARKCAQHLGKRRRLRTDERRLVPGARRDELRARAQVTRGVAPGLVDGERRAEDGLAGAHALPAAADGGDERLDGARLAGLADADDGDDFHGGFLTLLQSFPDA